MSLFRRLSIGVFLLLCCCPLWAQWSGSADFSTGIGGIEGSIISENEPMFHGLMQGVFKLNYKTEKFSWITTVDGKWEPKTTDNTRMAYKNERLNVTYKAASTRPLTGSLKTEFAWTPSKERNYSTWILYKYKDDKAFNHSLTFDGNAQAMENMSYYNEVPTLSEHRLETGVKTFRSFDSGRSILRSSLTAQAVGNQKVNTWTVFKTGDQVGKGTAVEIEGVKGYARKYRITPNSFELKLDGDIHYQRTLRDDDIKLKIAPGARVNIQKDMDANSGANVVQVSIDKGADEVWKDSTRLRETFDYLSLRVEPYLKAEFRWKNLEANADYAPQVFGRRLNDDTHQQPIKIKGIYPVGNAKLKWTISPMHSLTLTNKMSVSHPEYIKICWYDRTAGYLDQLYRGNEQLKSPQTRQYGLEYGFKYKRFSSTTGFTYKCVIDEIDQTWSNEEIDGRQYKVFRWLNSADSYSGEISQKLAWKGKIITANVSITYNQSHRIAKSNGAVKNSFDWKLNGDISAKLGKGWSIGSEAKYKSKTATFFTIFDQYCELNAFVQKEFKRITLYLRGKDLLDKPVQTQFESDELKEFWIEEVRNNRRIAVLGVKWNF